MLRAVNRSALFGIAALSCLAGCGGGASPPSSPATPSPQAGASATLASGGSGDEPHPSLRLPTDVHPTAEGIALTIRPDEASFSGSVDIDVTLDHARRSVWLHARGLHVTNASLTPPSGAPIAATWADEDDHGLGRLVLAGEAPAGSARIHVEFDAPFVAGNMGLFKVKEAGTAYAFTQFEAIDARRAFPCFDEPSYKIPFTVTLDVPEGDQAITNTPETSRAPAAPGVTRVRFATTRPLPSYLIAFAVGPLDVVKAADVPPNAVRARPLPLRGVTPKGRGPEMAYALAHVGEILTALEGTFGIAYPYEKMDILAVPDMSGAMENAGAVTFEEQYLLFDPKTAPVWQRSGFAMVVAHEFSHQWFGDLVTMAWWDDTWLNESFAEWMGYRISQQWDPSLEGDLELADETQAAIGADSLVSARQIHQAITSSDDIENAFDNITYQKGASVIAMFERWLGPDVFMKGVRQHLAQHAYGNAVLGDFLGALSAASGRDVATPYGTFLDQPGVPYLEAAVVCDPGAARLHLRQSRFLPQGSTGDPNRTWQVPVCAKIPDGKATREACTLLTSTEGDLALGATCPAWVLPNAHGTGYYRFALSPADLAKVRTTALPSLDTRERIALGNSLRAGFNHGSTHFADVLDASAPLVDDPDERVAHEPMGWVGMAHDWLALDPARPHVEAYARRLVARPFAKLGWTRGKNELPATTKRRSALIDFLVGTARDPAVRAEAKRRGLAYVGFGTDGAVHRDAVDENLAGNALWVVGQEATPAQFDALVALLSKTQDDVLRERILGALGAARDPQLASRARDLSLDEHIRYSEMLTPLWSQMNDVETREAAWTWIKAHWDALAARTSNVAFQGLQLLALPGSFCDAEHEKDVATFLEPRAAKLDGGPRAARKTIEEIHLCVAKRTVEEANVRAFFAK